MSEPTAETKPQLTTEEGLAHPDIMVRMQHMSREQLETHISELKGAAKPNAMTEKILAEAEKILAAK